MHFNTAKRKLALLLLDASRVLHSFKLLRVLDLEHIDIGPRCPAELELLVQLAFLAIRGTFTLIPPWIAKLANLETFFVNPYSWLSFPSSLWDLKRLKNLYIVGRYAEGILPLEYLDSSSVLNELDRLSGVHIPSEVSIETLMRKFPNIRRLKYTMSLKNQEQGHCYKFVIPDYLSQLQSLSVSHQSGYLRTSDFCFPAHLRKLELSAFELSGINMSTIGELPNLEVLRMMYIKFEGDTWELNEREFSKLRILSLYSKGLVRWRSCDDQFLRLQKLLLRRCETLEEMPLCLDSIPTLEMIEVHDCSVAVENLVKVIEETQENFGNFGLKVIIKHY